jgi:alpha-amylase
MGKLSKKLVSIVTAVVVMSGLAFTSLPAIEAKAMTTITSTQTYEDPMAAAIKDQVESYSVTNYGLTNKTKDGTILHAFCWSFNSIKANMADIANAGYSTVQTSPANTINSSHPNMKILGSDTSGGTDGIWWWHYQPTDWKIGNYQLGTREEFKTMCAEAEKYGVKIIVDVLPNHTTPELGLVAQELKSAAGGDLYHANGFKGIQNSGDWSWGNRLAATTGMMGGLPDVNTENKGFQAYYMNYVNDIIACGGDGFRYDTAKHIGVPSDPKDSKSQENDFWPVVTGKKAVNGVSLANNGNLFIYGEVLQGDNVPETEYANYIEMTASSYGGKLRGAIGSKNFSVGNLSGWNHATPDKIVTWVESHDTYFNGG